MSSVTSATFQCSLAIGGQWLPQRGAQIQNLPIIPGSSVGGPDLQASVNLAHAVPASAQAQPSPGPEGGRLEVLWLS